MAGDELDDQLEYDVASSDESDAASADSPAAPAAAGVAMADDMNGGPAKSAEPSDKKARQKAKQKERKRLKNEADRTQKQQLALMEPALIADYISKLVAKTEPELSAIGLQDRCVPEARIVSTESVAPGRESIDSYKQFFAELGLAKKAQGKRDLVLVLCMSAIRVCEVVRALRKADCGGALKLIKQNKPDYDKRCLKSPAHVAVTTPGRVETLRKLRILDTKRIKRVVVDTSHLDAKQRTVWDIDGTVSLVAELAHKNQASVYLY